nr:succinoglycan biosynthesis protein exop [Rhizobium sp. Q54]
MIIDPHDEEVPALPELEGRAMSWTFKGVLGLSAGAILAGALVALPLAIWLPRETQAEATLKVAQGELSSSQVDDLSRLLTSDTALDRIAGEFGRRGFGHPQPMSAPAFILDLLLGRADTAPSRADSLRDLLSGSVTLAAADGGARLVITANAPDADRASDIANGVAAVLVDRENPVFPVGDFGLARLEEASRRAETELRQFEAGSDEEKLEAARRAEAEKQEASQEAAATEARIADLDRKIEEATSLTVADVLEGQVPDSLEFTALEYHRQRHVEAKLAFDQLSVRLGPRHPRLQNAAGAVETARNDLDEELARLVANLRQQKAETSHKLAALRSRDEAVPPDVRDLAAKLASLEAASQAARQEYEKAVRAARADDSDQGPFLSLEVEAHPERAAVTGWSLPEAMGLGGATGLAVTIALALRRRRGADDAEVPEPDHGFVEAHGLAADRPVPDHVPKPIPDGLSEVDTQPDDEVPLPERIRDILYRNAVPAASAGPVPPLVGAVLEGKLSAGGGRSSWHAPAPANDRDLLDREILELRDHLAALRERVGQRSHARR